MYEEVGISYPQAGYRRAYISMEGLEPFSTFCHILLPHKKPSLNLTLFDSLEYRFQIYTSQPLVSEPYKVVAKLSVGWARPPRRITNTPHISSIDITLTSCSCRVLCGEA